MKEMEGGLSVALRADSEVTREMAHTARILQAREVVDVVEGRPEHRIEARGRSQERRGQRLEVHEM